MERDPNVFGKRLKRLARSKGMDMRDFSEVTGVPYRTVVRWVSGSRRPSRKRLEQVCAHAGWPASWLIGPDAEKMTPVEREFRQAVSLYDRRLQCNLPQLPAALARIGHVLTQYMMELGVPCALRQDPVGISYIDISVPGVVYQIQIRPSRSGVREPRPELILKRGEAIAFRLKLEVKKVCLRKIQRLVREITGGKYGE